MLTRILHIEDNPGDARLFEEAILAFRGGECALTQAKRLSEATDLLRGGEFDIVVSDLGLPDSSGIETVLQLREANASVPIVVLTGLSDQALGLEALRSGADDYLVKGEFDADSLSRAVRYSIERKVATSRAQDALRDEARIVETLHRIGSTLLAELDLQRVVQTVTDEATSLTRAQFGAFFYNVLDDRGEAYTLYTLSGVPRSAFEQFPMPRNTQVFGPTFNGDGVVRSGDITKDARYGHNAPYRGMPEGHLPVRSYLAVPVISRSGDVLGGLFFGHSDTNVFVERDERIVAGIAAWAALAMDNARLYDAERRARAEAEHANRAKSDFLTTMSHELRTPLNAMIGYTDLWLLGIPTGLPPVFHPQVERVRLSSKHLLQLIEEILTFARIEAAQETILLEEGELSDLIQTVASFVEPLALQKKLLFEIIGPAHSVPVALHTDVRKVRQVLINLLSNAVKFTDAGSVTMTAAQEGPDVVFVVTDTGIGLKEPDLERIFEPFWQARDNEGTRPGGTGLGLSVTRKLVHLLGGEIAVTSQHGVGTQFVVRLPAKLPSVLPPIAPASE